MTALGLWGEVAWLVLGAILVWGLLWILWPWRQIPAILYALAASDLPPREGSHDEPPQDAGAWYATQETTQEPGKKNVFFPEDPDLSGRGFDG